MIKRRITLIVVIGALLMTGIVSADPNNWGGGGRAGTPTSGMKNITQTLTHHHAKSPSGITISLKR